MDRNRVQSVGRRMSRQQSASGPPQVEMVSVAVLPPRLPPNMAPPTGIGAADAFSWDESVNWQHNESIDSEKEPGKGKKLLRKVGLTTTRKRTNDDMPPFTFRQVPYDTWRKHYAKDKDGNYHGTHAPAEDCLLKPEDVAKWRIEPPRTKADRWTRGSEALPVYAEVRESAAVPDYDEVRDSPAIPEYEEDYTRPPPEERTLSIEDAKVSSEAASEPNVPRRTIADGKTAQQIIDEAKKKNEENPRKSVKGYLKKGFEMASMGS